MPEGSPIDEQLQQVMARLEQLGSDLEKLSSAIWQHIDHDDPAGLEQGVRFKQGYNERRSALEETMTEMLGLLRDYPGSGLTQDTAESHEAVGESQSLEIPDANAEPILGRAVEGEPIAIALDQKVPFGFVLSGQTFSSASAWPLFYETLLQELYGRESEKLSRLADAPSGFAQDGRPLFARYPDALDDPLPIADKFFAEADLAPEALLKVIKRLIGVMGYPLESLKVLVKEKNRGTVETLSLAA